MAKVALFAATFAMLACAAVAQATDKSWHLVRSPNGTYTVPIADLAHPGTSGKITLQPHGPRTIVTIYVHGNVQHHAFNLHEGKDCSRLAPPAGIVLNPTKAGQASKTIVAVPIDALASKDYVLAIRDATSKARFLEACQHI